MNLKFHNTYLISKIILGSKNIIQVIIVDSCISLKILAYWKFIDIFYHRIEATKKS